MVKVREKWETSAHHYKSEASQMTNLTYTQLINRGCDKFFLQEKIFSYLKTHTLVQAAEEFGCHINTIYKIKMRGNDGEFGDRSRARKTQENAISDQLVSEILNCRADKKMGPLNLKYQYDLECSPSTIYRVLKRHPGQILARRRKWKQSKDLRQIKAKYKAFEHLQMDGKVLTDIPHFFNYLKDYDLPKLQYTITCQKTGITFISYAKGETMLEACSFVVYIFEHLAKYGIDISKIKLKTDCGSYAIGSMNSRKISSFSQLIQHTYKAKHRTNRHKNQNADVERFHGLVEQYFYSLTHISSKTDFFSKSNDFMAWFNLIRKNGSKNWATPSEILKNDFPNIDPNIVLLQPIDLNLHTDLFFFKTIPNHQPLTKLRFFDGNPPHLHPDDFHFFLGDAKRSRYLSKNLHDVVKLDVD